MTAIGDKKKTCRDCNNEFVFTIGEQDFFRDKGFEHEPTRCAQCRAVRRQEKEATAAPQD